MVEADHAGSGVHAEDPRVGSHAGQGVALVDADFQIPINSEHPMEVHQEVEVRLVPACVEWLLFTLVIRFLACP